MTPLKIEDFSAYRFLSEVKLSKDADSAVFVVSECDMEKNKYRKNIWVARQLQGEAPHVRQLTFGGSDMLPAWLEDQSVLFRSARGEESPREGNPSSVFYRISLDGGEAEKAFSIPYPVSAIQQLENGLYLLSADYDPSLPLVEDRTDPVKKQAALDRYQEEMDYVVLDELPFCRNGEGFTNKKRNRLYIYDAGTDQLRPLSPDLFHVEHWDYNREAGKIIYSGCPYGDRPAPQDFTTALVIVDLETETSHTLLKRGHLEILALGFMEERILFLGTDHGRFGLNENPWLYQIAGTGEVSILMELDDSFCSSVGSDCRLGGGKNFLINGDSVYYTATDRFRSALRRCCPDSGSLDFIGEQDGSCDCFDIAGQTCVMVAMRGQKLQELYLKDLNSGSERRISALNLSALEGKYVAEPVPLTVYNRDGLDLDGWVLLPHGYQHGKSYPAILDIHGGPKTVYGTVFYHEMQLWAGMGYFVLFCNPRGGDGRGNSFADIRGRYGQDDYNDILDFVDTVLEQYPDIDERRIAVTGGSYGGFMTNWIIGHTGRFVAAASQRSISNWVSMAGTSDIGYCFADDQTDGSIWEKDTQMWRESPLRYANQCTTPTLFIHAFEDYRCPVSEGLQMFSALQHFGVPSRCCLFKGENHELSRSGLPKHRIRRLREITDWFQKYCKKT